MSKENPATLKYIFLSAITNPTVKNILAAGKNGKTSKVNASATNWENDDSSEFSKNILSIFFCVAPNISITALIKIPVITIQKKIISKIFAVVWNSTRIEKLISQQIHSKHPIDQSKQSQAGASNSQKFKVYM